MSDCEHTKLYAMDFANQPQRVEPCLFCERDELRRDIERLQAERDRAGEEAEAMEAGVTDLVCELNDMRAERDAALLRLDRAERLLATAYQLAGLVGAPERFLDAYSRHEGDIDSLLPVTMDELDEFQSLALRLGSSILIEDLGEDAELRYRLEYRNGGAVGHTLEEALTVMAGLVKGYEPPDAQPPVSRETPECEHEWVDARNEVITSGEWCRKCNAVRAGASGETPEICHAHDYPCDENGECIVCRSAGDQEHATDCELMDHGGRGRCTCGAVENQRPVYVGFDLARPGSDRTVYACPKHGPILYGNRCLTCERAADLCSDCPPAGYPTDETRCVECPRASENQRAES